METIAVTKHYIAEFSRISGVAGRKNGAGEPGLDKWLVCSEIAEATGLLVRLLFVWYGELVPMGPMFHSLTQSQ
jgi:hypothetical protein